MLTHEQISLAVNKVAESYPIKKVSYFGSYADGNATEDSDLDLLVEFKPDEKISLFEVSGIKIDMEDLLNIPVDVIPLPLPENSIIEINKVVRVYG